MQRLMPKKSTMAEFRLSRKATADLQSIWVYTFRNWSREQADKYTHLLKGECRTLAQNPALGRNYKLIPTKYLGYKVEKHIIFYRIITPDEIKVVRILHGSMDLKNRVRD